jgi:hypothetical protein
VDELQTITHLGRTSPAIDASFFPNTSSSGFWSASPDAWNSGSACGVRFSYGIVSCYGKSANNTSVRMVRGGQ